MLEGFLKRVEEICAEQAKQGRAQAFAVILRDANDRDLKRILRDQGAYAKLDRLSGDRLSVFFVHTASDEAVARFNRTIGARIGAASPRLPAIAFFRSAVREDGALGLTDAKVVTLDNANIIHALHELYGQIELYLDQPSTPAPRKPGLRGKAFGAGKFVSLEVLRAAIRGAIGLFF